MISSARELFERPPPPLPEGAPETDFRVAPASAEEFARLLEHASEHDLTVLVWGGGTHQGIGTPPEPDLLLLTSGLGELVAWEPEDLTVVVGAGTPVRYLEDRLAERGQTAVLPEMAGTATVGGVLAAGVSGWRRGRYGPSRDRILEVELVTGDGRIVRAGGRVVKNVTGYDLARLAVGSLGALGVISQVCLKLWPLPEATLTIIVGSAAAALESAYRPLAVLETPEETAVYLGGTRAEVEAQAAALGGDARPGLHWPEPDPLSRETAGWSLRVPPADVSDALERLPDGWRFVAQHQVGEVALTDPAANTDQAAELRRWAEGRGGNLVMLAAPPSARAELDPWGSPPPLLETQRRLVRRFDPARVINPGRLPGGL